MASPSALLPNTPPQLREGSTKTSRKVYIGIPSSSIAAGATVDVLVPVLEEFRLNRLFLSVPAQALNVTNIRVGTKPLNVSSNGIPGNTFSEQAINNELSGYVASPGQQITLSVSNPTASAVVLTGGFMGWAAL